MELVPLLVGETPESLHLPLLPLTQARGYVSTQ